MYLIYPNILASVLASNCYYDKLLQLVGFNNSKFIFLESKTQKTVYIFLD